MDQLVFLRRKDENSFGASIWTFKRSEIQVTDSKEEGDSVREVEIFPVPRVQSKNTITGQIEAEKRHSNVRFKQDTRGKNRSERSARIHRGIQNDPGVSIAPEIQGGGGQIPLTRI